MEVVSGRTVRGPIEIVLAAAVAGLVFVTVAQVLLRYLTDQPLAWTEEFARFLFVWTCFLGAVVGARRGTHFAIGIFVDALHGRTKTWVRLSVLLLEAAFYGGLAWSGLESVHGPSFRAVYDLSALDRSRFMMAPGQSGNLLSVHARDFLVRWRDGDTISLALDPAIVAATITLTPTGTP